MKFCLPLDFNIIHIGLLKCLLQISRLKVLKKWKLNTNTNTNREETCIQALISKVNLLRSVDHGHCIDTQETQEIIRESYSYCTISTRNVAAIIRIWAVLWFLNNMAMVQAAMYPNTVCQKLATDTVIWKNSFSSISLQWVAETVCPLPQFPLFSSLWIYRNLYGYPFPRLVYWTT